MTDKAKEELIEEVKFLQERIAELETVDTERKQQQQQQQQQQQDIRRLATVVRDSNDAVIIQDIDGRITVWNRGAEQMYGYKEQEALRMNIERLTPPEKAAEYKEFTRRLIAGEAVTSFETQRLIKDGRVLEVWLTVTKLVDDTGKLVGIVSTERDITERKKAEEVLRESERSLAQVQQLAQLGSWKFIPATGKTAWSEEMFRIYGLEPANEAPPFEVLTQMVHEEDRQRWGKAIEEGRRTGRFYNLEYRIIRPDGQCRWLLAQESMKETLPVFYGTVLDITERKKTEEALRQALKKEVESREMLVSTLEDNNQVRERLEKNMKELKESQAMLGQSEKLASLGRLVSDMAHEVNNPLMIISGNAQLSLLDESLNEELKNNLKIIHEECNRAKSIIQRLLMFSRPSKGEQKPLDINQSIESVVKLLEHQFSLSNVKISLQFNACLPFIMTDEKQLQEVIMNLLNNARDAMPKGGEIAISTFLDGEYLKINIKDSGAGMEDKTLTRAFEPFFTTKEKGTGLGLSVCYGIIKAHNGKIEIKSQLQKGTTVHIWLPLKAEGA